VRTTAALRRLAALSAGAALALALTACGREQSVLEQTHIGGERFERVTFDDLPRPDNGKQTSYKAKGVNQTEVVEIAATSAQNALDWYDQALTAAGWTKKTGPEETRDGTLVTYTRQGRTVALVAAEGQAKGDQPTPADVTVSFNNLSLP
jgi:hypothetical protein